MSGDVKQDDLDRLSSELLARLSKDDVGPPATAGSHLVGRLVMASTALENLLRAAVVYAAAIEAQPVQALLAPVGGKKPNLQRVTAGPLAHGLKNYFARRPPTSIPVGVAPLLDDLLQDNSKILAFIKTRNDSAHQGGDPKLGAAAAKDLKKVVQDFRRRAGWK